MKVADFWIPNNVPSLKNSKRVVTPRGKRHSAIVESKLVTKYRAATAWHWKLHAPTFRSAAEGLANPLSVKFEFIRSSHRKFDYINAAQIVCDMMVDYAWIADDNCACLFPAFLPHTVSKRCPGVYIHLFRESIPPNLRYGDRVSKESN